MMDILPDIIDLGLLLIICGLIVGPKSAETGQHQLIACGGKAYHLNQQIELYSRMTSNG